MEELLREGDVSPRVCANVSLRYAEQKKIKEGHRHRICFSWRIDMQLWENTIIEKNM